MLRQDVSNGVSVKRLKKVETAIRQADRLTTLVEGLLNVSRLSLGSPQLDIDEFDLVPLIRETVGQLADHADRVDCRLNVRVPTSAIGRWDKARIEETLTSLLVNALKYGPGKPVDLDLEIEAGTARISVRDRGLGISTQDLPRIFGRFERAVPSRRYGGLGLGLYIARQIVEAHGGTIEVKSQVGEGSTFVVVLPRQKASTGKATNTDVRTRR